MPVTRPAAVAGMFYPGDATTLARDVRAFLKDVQPPALTPKALIAPHAGYIYSGVVAASAYALLKPIANRIRRVILLGPTHRGAVRGVALPGVEAFATPLGEVAVDMEAARAIAELPQVTVSPQAHALEHSLEVHLPFLQSVLSDFKLLPLAVGMASAEEVAEVLETLWGGDETLIVVSSDLSHFLPYETARRVDGDTAQAILQLRQDITHEQACGGTPVNGLLLAARKHQLQPHLLDLRNSGDTAGSKDKVVGYAAFAFATPAPQDTRGQLLLKLARDAIGSQLGYLTTPAPAAPWLQELGAVFVTLTQNGNLRGCIGSLEAHRPLGEDVRQNAVAAAFRDPRFSPLRADEFNATRVEVSLLSAAETMDFTDEAYVLSQLRPGVDGVILEYGLHRGTFLPQVWEQLPDRQQFMAQLKRKAGLPADFWADGIRLSRYTVTKWKEV